MSLQVGQHIAGRYRIEALLGSGGVGTVYSAIQEPLDRRVAIKTLRAELSQNPAVRRRFVREARAAIVRSALLAARGRVLGREEQAVARFALGELQGEVAGAARVLVHHLSRPLDRTEAVDELEDLLG